MVHHIVMWKFKPEIEENKKEELKKAMDRPEKVHRREGPRHGPGRHQVLPGVFPL